MVRLEDLYGRCGPQYGKKSTSTSFVRLICGKKYSKAYKDHLRYCYGQR